MKIVVEKIIANRIQFRCFGCHIDGPTHLFRENKSVTPTSILTSYCLKKNAPIF
jgi:hypothetical protein